VAGRVLRWGAGQRWSGVSVGYERLHADIVAPRVASLFVLAGTISRPPEATDSHSARIQCCDAQQRNLAAPSHEICGDLWSQSTGQGRYHELLHATVP
jgi:hypothetical protein